MPGLFLFGTIRNLIRFGGKGGNGEDAMPETERHQETDTSDRKYQQTTIGDLRKTYGATFAKGLADDEKLPDALRKKPSLRNVIRHQESERLL